MLIIYHIATFQIQAAIRSTLISPRDLLWTYSTTLSSSTWSPPFCIRKCSIISTIFITITSGALCSLVMRLFGHLDSATRKAMKHLEPIIQHRLDMDEKYGADWPEGNRPVRGGLRSLSFSATNKYQH